MNSMSHCGPRLRKDIMGEAHRAEVIDALDRFTLSRESRMVPTVKTEIYYFTGTGNSLVVARDIAERTDGDLISIPSMMGRESIESDADSIGIVFPVYHATFGESGIPIIVRKFVEKLKNIDSKYIFAVCTCDGMPVATIGNMSKIIAFQGGKLSAGFTVRMGVPYSTAEKLKYALFHKEMKADVEEDEKKHRKLYSAWQEKLKTVQECVNARKVSKLETARRAKRTVLTPLVLLSKKAARSRFMRLSNSSSDSFDELTQLADRSFRTNDRCNGCRICARICPVNNIEMIGNRPVWGGRCENCYACFQWCPKGAIYGDNIEYNKRYHHQDVKVSDLILRD